MTHDIDVARLLCATLRHPAGDSWTPDPTWQCRQNAADMIEALLDTIEGLEGENARRHAGWQDSERRISNQLSYIEELKTECDQFEARALAAEQRVVEMESALRFYANPELYKPHPHGPAFDHRDVSYVAIRALASEGGAGE